MEASEEQDPETPLVGVVLYIDDHAGNRELMEQRLETVVPLISACDAETGLEVAKSEQPALILMDINLPGIDGIEATRRLKADPDTASIPVVAVSAAIVTGENAVASDVGFEAFLTKPVSEAELMAIIARFVSESEPTADAPDWPCRGKATAASEG